MEAQEINQRFFYIVELLHEKQIISDAKELRKALGMTDYTWQRYMNYEMRIKKRYLIDIINLYPVAPCYLLRGGPGKPLRKR